MTNELLKSWFETSNGKRLDLILRGETFGERYGESPQLVSELVIEDSRFTIRFESTETLVILNPRSVRLRGGPTQVGGFLQSAGGRQPGDHSRNGS